MRVRLAWFACPPATASRPFVARCTRPRSFRATPRLVVLRDWATQSDYDRTGYQLAVLAALVPDAGKGDGDRSLGARPRNNGRSPFQRAGSPGRAPLVVDHHVSIPGRAPLSDVHRRSAAAHILRPRVARRLVQALEAHDAAVKRSGKSGRGVDDFDPTVVYCVHADRQRASLDGARAGALVPLAGNQHRGDVRVGPDLVGVGHEQKPGSVARETHPDDSVRRSKRQFTKAKVFHFKPKQ